MIRYWSLLLSLTSYAQKYVHIEDKNDSYKFPIISADWQQ